MKTDDYNPNSASHSDQHIFGLPQDESESQLVLLPIGFDATTSYFAGTSKGPQSVLKSSQQVDLFHPIGSESWKKGIYLRPENAAIAEWNTEARSLVTNIRELDETKDAAEIESQLKRVNEISNKLNDFLKDQVEGLLSQNKTVGILGGDHSVPFSSIAAHIEKYPKLGLLHIDAHFDFRKAYEGFENSHASIMYNVVTKTVLQSLTTIGIRDYCEEEIQFAFENKMVKRFTDDQIFERKSEGQSWKDICTQIIETLPDQVYVSFDIDGLEPQFCPGTGTPVPGGLSYNEAVYLLRSLFKAGKQIVGFDLCEVGPTDFDGNIGARILYELSVLSIESQRRKSS